MSFDDPTDVTPAPPARLLLGPRERRVLGVLIEKSLSTPEYYPMTTKAIVAACNQKNNRHPVTSHDEDDVQEALSSLQMRRIVIAVKESSGRATKWRQELQRVYNLQGREQAVLAELMLRGPQAEGELRARASRMKEIDDLDALHEVLASLRDRAPSFVVRLSPEGQVRGVRHAHALYSDDELQRLEKEAAEQGTASEVAVSAASRGARLEELEERLQAVEQRLARLETALGLESESEG